MFKNPPKLYYYDLLPVNLQPFTTPIELIIAWIANNKLKCLKVAQMHGHVGDGVRYIRILCANKNTGHGVVRVTCIPTQYLVDLCGAQTIPH